VTKDSYWDYVLVLWLPLCQFWGRDHLIWDWNSHFPPLFALWWQTKDITCGQIEWVVQCIIAIPISVPNPKHIQVELVMICPKLTFFYQNRQNRTRMTFLLDKESSWYYYSYVCAKLQTDGPWICQVILQKSRLYWLYGSDWDHMMYPVDQTKYKILLNPGKNHRKISEDM